MNTEQPEIPEDLLSWYEELVGYRNGTAIKSRIDAEDVIPLIERIARLTSELAAANLRVEGLEKERDEALAANELDRRSLHAVVRQIEEEITGRMWLIEGRGPYEWDDDKYRQEFGWAIHALQEKLEPLRKIAGDLKNCPTTEAGVNSVRALEAENAALATRLEGLVREVAKWKDKPAATLPRLVVCAIIIRGGNVLLERRAPSCVDGLDGMWDLPGGKVEPGETPNDAIVREIAEELSIGVRPARPLPFLPTSTWKYADGEQRHWILAAYLCEIISGEPVETETLKWFPITALPDNILDADRTLVNLAVQFRGENAALKARVEQLTNPITLTETLTHSRTCSAGYDLDADCICGLDYRIQLQTEQNLHAAWMKRAMEAEARVEQLSGPVTEDGQ